MPTSLEGDLCLEKEMPCLGSWHFLSSVSFGKVLILSYYSLQEDRSLAFFFFTSELYVRFSCLWGWGSERVDKALSMQVKAGIPSQVLT